MELRARLVGVRLVVDTCVHAMGWTREETIRYCRANASPGATARSRTRSKFDVRAFHDLILGGGQLPPDPLEKNVRRWVAKQKQEAERKQAARSQ